MRLKVLKIPPYIDYEISKNIYSLQEIEPEFKRDGLYLLGKDCWIEVKGKAYKYNSDSFKNHIFFTSQLEKLIREEEYKILKKLKQFKLTSIEQEHMIDMYEYSKQIKNMNFNSKKLKIRILQKRIKNG
jgi:hypothetical protein